ACRLQTLGQSGEVDCPVSRSRDLDSIPSTESCCYLPAFTAQEFKLAQRARRTICSLFEARKIEPVELKIPNIDSNKRIVQRFHPARKKFQRFGSLNRRDHRD